MDRGFDLWRLLGSLVALLVYLVIALLALAAAVYVVRFAWRVAL